MKKKLFLLSLILLGMCSAVIAANSKFIRPFYYDKNESHSYSLYSTQSFTGLDKSTYSIRFYVNKNHWSMSEGHYSRIEILKNESIIAQINNDNTWVKFSANESTKDIAKVRLVSSQSIVILLEGMTDFTGQPEISVIVINNNGVSVVYNQRHEILNYSESSKVCMNLSGSVFNYDNFDFNKITDLASITSDSIQMEISTKEINLNDLKTGKVTRVFNFMLNNEKK